jgi:hypothetical protein
MRIRAEMSEKRTKKSIPNKKKNQWNKEMALWKDKKIDKSWTKIKRQKTPINKIGHEIGDITTNTWP